MKRKYRFPALLAALCLALCACCSNAPERSSSVPAVTPGSTAPSHTIAPEITLPRQEPVNELQPEKCGAVRISYLGSPNSIRYITDASQLPDNEALKKYDDAYFREHALVLVMETVGSGSIQVGIASIAFEGSKATVTLSHKLPDEAGTSDMATWLLWAEVDAGLEYVWTVANHTYPPENYRQ